MCILPGALACSNWNFSKIRDFDYFSDFKIKSSENSCKNNNFDILFKIDFKYTKIIII